MLIKVDILEGPLPRAQTCDLLLDGQSIELANAGAWVVFEGLVRPNEDAMAIRGLQYQAYEPMAEKQLARLAELAVARFGVLAIFVEHSRGFVAEGCCSFRLKIAGTHRQESLAAMDWFIQQMKADVPIWKTAVFVDQNADTVVPMR